MNAVKFMEEYSRMCKAYREDDCSECPLRHNDCFGVVLPPQHSYAKIVKAVEKWSKENPDIIGKKYIIEIDKAEFDSTYAKTMLRVKGVKCDGVGEVWLDKEFIEQLAESKE